MHFCSQSASYVGSRPPHLRRSLYNSKKGGGGQLSLYLYASQSVSSLIAIRNNYNLNAAYDFYNTTAKTTKFKKMHLIKHDL